MSNSNPTIAFIGAGNMAGAIIRGLLENSYPATNIWATAASQKNLAILASDYKIRTSLDKKEISAGADIVVLGVKPQAMKSVCGEIGDTLSPDTLLVSLAAGVTCASISAWLGSNLAVVRCMSNTPAQIRVGASGLFANDKATTEQKMTAEMILGAVGIVRWVEEERLIDTVTAIAGSGPAYFFLFIESIIDAAVEQGMPRATATELAVQTALGAAELARKSGEDINVLRQQVTSPKGTTEQAIASFEADNLRSAVKNAMCACVRRAQELAVQE